MKQYRKLQVKALLFSILRWLAPFLLLVVSIVVSSIWNDMSSILLSIIFAVLAVSSYIFFSNRAKQYQLVLEDDILNDCVKGIFHKKKICNARGYLTISELVKNDILTEPYKRYGFLYYEVIYNQVTIDSSNITLEYLEESTKKRKKSYYGFVGRAIRYELRSHKPLYLINKKSKYFHVENSLVDDDTFLVSGEKLNYDRLNRRGDLDKLKKYCQDKDYILSVFYLREAVYILIEGQIITINPKFKDKIDEAYISKKKEQFAVPRDLAEILNITK